MLAQALADYQCLLDAYLSQEAALAQQHCDWQALHKLMEQSAACIERIQAYDMQQWDKDAAQQLQIQVEHCAAAHRRIGAALIQRRTAMGADVHQQQLVSKALRAYQGQ